VSADPFEGWAICELLGRRRLAGYVTADAPLMQATRLKVDIYPGDAAAPAATQFTSYPVYCLTPCTEDMARKVGALSIRDDMPVAQWQVTARPDPWAAIAAGDPDYVDADIVDGELDDVSEDELDDDDG